MKVRTLTISVIVFLASVGAWAAWQERTQLLTDPASTDEVLVNDVSDTTDNAAGTVKRTTLTNLMKILGSLISDSGAFRVKETTSGAEWSIQVYDNDDATWRSCLTFTNGNSPAMSIGEGCSFTGVDEVNVSAVDKYLVGGNELVDDTATDGDTTKVWSADKSYDTYAAPPDIGSTTPPFAWTKMAIYSKTAATYTIGTDNAREAYGGTFLNGDDDAIAFTWPATLVAGMSACFGQDDGATAAITVNPGTDHYIILDGTKGTVSTAIASTGAAGDEICMQAISTTILKTWGKAGTWEE